MSSARGRTLRRPNSFHVLWLYLSFIFFKNSENNIFLKNELIIHHAFPVFLTNNLLIPDVSCITSCLTSVYLKCFLSISTVYFYRSWCHFSRHVILYLSHIDELFDDTSRTRSVTEDPSTVATAKNDLVLGMP